MTHQEYREYVAFKCVTDEACSLMGLFGETGEVVDYLKKVKHHGHELDRKKLGNELGDLLFYFVDIGRRHGIHVEDQLRLTRRLTYGSNLLPYLAMYAACVWFHPKTVDMELYNFFSTYCALLTEQGFTFEEVMSLNKEKLDARYKARFTPEESRNR